MKYIIELYSRLKIGGPGLDSFTHIWGEASKIEDSSIAATFEEISSPYGEEDYEGEVWSQMYICAYVVNARSGAWFRTEDGYEYYLSGDTWQVAPPGGGEFLPMEEPFPEFSGDVTSHFNRFGW